MYVYIYIYIYALSCLIRASHMRGSEELGALQSDPRVYLGPGHRTNSRVPEKNIKQNLCSGVHQRGVLVKGGLAKI